MKHPIKIRLGRPKNPGAALKKLQTEARKHGIFFEGDEQSGRASGRGFSGSYNVHPEGVVLQIHQKPFLVPAEMLANKVREVCAEYLANE